MQLGTIEGFPTYLFSTYCCYLMFQQSSWEWKSHYCAEEREWYFFIKECCCAAAVGWLCRQLWGYSRKKDNGGSQRMLQWQMTKMVTIWAGHAKEQGTSSVTVISYVLTSMVTTNSVVTCHAINLELQYCRDICMSSFTMLWTTLCLTV